MGAKFLEYASTAAQAANTSTTVRVSPGKGNYAVQKLVDAKQTAPEGKQQKGSRKTDPAKTSLLRR